MIGAMGPRTDGDGLAYQLSTRGALEHPVTIGVVAVVVGALVFGPLVALVLRRTGRMSAEVWADMRIRTRTWMLLAPAIVAPIVLCPLSAMAMVCVASILCYREYARATGLFRHRMLSAIVVAGIVGVAFAAADHWRGLFTALTPLSVVALAVAGILPDQPRGYLQRVSLAVVGFLLFGAGLGHLSMLANHPGYRPILCVLVLLTQASDIAAYCFGKALGRRRLFPATSPNKTLEGHLGALLVVAPAAAVLSHLAMEGTGIDRVHRLAILGLIVAVGAQMGDLMLGSIKRDVGVKDMGAALPGHGGFLDRFNSVLLVAPAAYWLISLYVPLGADRPVRVFTGG